MIFLITLMLQKGIQKWAKYGRWEAPLGKHTCQGSPANTNMGSIPGRKEATEQGHPLTFTHSHTPVHMKHCTHMWLCNNSIHSNSEMFLQSETTRVKHHSDEWEARMETETRWSKTQRDQKFQPDLPVVGPFRSTVSFHFVFPGKTCIKQIYAKVSVAGQKMMRFTSIQGTLCFKTNYCLKMWRKKLNLLSCKYLEEQWDWMLPATHLGQKRND